MGKSYRLPNGFGSVYKLSGNRRRPWVAAKTFGWNEKGKQIKKIIGYCETKKEALQLLMEFNNNPLTNAELVNLNFKEAFNRWINRREKENDISLGNIRTYKSVFNNHCTNIYNIKVMELTTKDFQHCIDNCTTGYNTKRYIKLIASQVYKYCTIDLDMPIRIKFANGLKIGQQEQSDMHIPYTYEEVQILWENISLEYVDSILLSIYCGFRPTELLTIELSNIYLEQRYMIGGIKTKAGINRIIPIHEDIVPIIEGAIKKNKQYLIEKKEQKVNYRHYLDIYNKIMATLNLNHKPHDGRHTLATELDNVGANDVCVKLILGHTIDDITKGVYTHKETSQLIDTINLIKFC